VDELPADLRVVADPDQLVQVFANLVCNAIAVAPRVGVRARREDERLLLEVWDTGPGVPRHLGERIFEPFVSGGAGKGLGLAITDRIARSFGWTLGHRRDPGRTVFALAIPS
jgi:signal transduction histidine kinase